MLTHRGRSLEDVEKFDNPQSDTDDDEDGQLEGNNSIRSMINLKLTMITRFSFATADFVEKTHFGGGLFKKSTRDENDTRRTIDQLIAESKLRKAERQQVKEETQTLTDKLDVDLKQYLPLISSSTKSEDDATFKKPNLESYDVLVRELRFAPIGKVDQDRIYQVEIFTVGIFDFVFYCSRLIN